MKKILKSIHHLFFIMVFFAAGNAIGQTSLFYDNFNQTPVNPILSSGLPTANYTVWTTVIPANDKGGTVIIEDNIPQDGVIKLLSMEHKDIQTGNRVEVSAPLSVYNAPFTPTLNANTKDLEWTFTMKQYRNSSGGATGFNGVQTGLAVVLAANGPTWGSQQGSNAKGYAVTFFKPTGQMYCASLSRFNGGLSNSTVLIGNKEEDVFSEFKTWITVKVTYSPSNNEWSLYFRDEYSQVTKGDINNANGLKLIGSVVDATYTNIEMSHFGFALNTPSTTTSANSNSMCVDDFSVKAIDINADKYKLNTSVLGEGDVSENPLAESHSFGSEVVLTATPREGYIFKEWSGDVKGFLNPTTVVVNADMNVVANFIPVPQELVEPKKLIHFDEKLLDAVKDEIGKGNPFFVEAYNSLISDAEKNMDKDANPVTNKTLLPASGDIHDYYSIGPYFWPDPNKPDGLPWIYKDGEVNPVSMGYDTDRVRFEDFEKELEQLIFAYYFSDNPKYAFKAMEYMDIWFVDEATKMNPNVNYGSARPGTNDGDRVAVLNFVKIQSVITAMQIFENKGILTEKTKVGVNKWIGEWSVWLQTSEKGIAERASGNNHGTWCDYQLMGLFLYEGNLQKAKDLANEFKTRRIASQIDTEGKQTEELKRTKTVNYSAMNLWAMTWFAYMAQQVDVDIWNYSTSDGRSIKKAYSFLKPYVLDPESWTLPNISNGGPVNAINTLWRPLFGKAITIFREDLLPLNENTSDNLTSVEKLQWPPKSQIYLTLSVASNKAESVLNVYPNPSRSIVHIEMKIAGDKHISIFNMQGQKVWETYTDLNKIALKKGGDLIPGIYIVKISGESIVQKKIIIQ
ncbi:T9SS C-terminal target domain-containing protein [Lutibacter sp. HS1-25]|nr:T9SS C-terminal target domain-containing protein [Lutibacter sp. HS1-25]